VARPEIIESTALGAAYLAALSSGFSDLHEIKRLSTNEAVFKPNMNEEMRDALYRKWKKAVSRCLDWED